MLTRIYKYTDNRSEICFYVESLSMFSQGEIHRLKLLINRLRTLGGVRTRSFLEPNSYIEIGPRLNIETPFSSNAVAAAHAIGLTKIQRIEHSVRYVINESQSKEEILAKYLDPMTQVVYPKEPHTFGSVLQPKPVKTVPILKYGEKALKSINTELGLGMDKFDITYYTKLFQELGRDPTDVELFQIGNANSEHSRHWFFRSKLVIDNVTMPETLFDIVKAPLRNKKKSNSIISFKDNAGVIEGFNVSTLKPSLSSKPGKFLGKCSKLNITATAETHNHPTLIAPFPGAETGSGGRIRDIGAAGRGSLVGTGLAGYCVGNLFIPNYEIPGENVGGENIQEQASPLSILIKGSDGISDYGNKFGEPLIGGFTRTFGQIVDGERLEFRKPVLYSAGVGQIDDRHTKKHRPRLGMRIVAIGGPAYRIGFGGGSASSMLQGENDKDLDFNSVQRGNAEMENKANRVIRACIEMGENNPIESIHDQGAGGPSNALTEIVEGSGGKIDIRKIVLGDKTMSVLEIWSAEYQERYSLLIKKKNLGRFREICEREGTNCEIVGKVTNDGKITVIDSKNNTTPVSLDIQEILTELKQKTFKSERVKRTFSPFVVPSNLTVRDAVEMVFRLPQVGSKGYLVHKVDRSVTGRVVQQQCCGPAQIPVANVSVTANEFSSYFYTTGTATAIGEQPIKMLINPSAGARMAVGEMLTNMVSVDITALEDIVCRANWMWPAKLKGEMPRLYDAAIAMRDIMIKLGISIDGGKDSLSMATKINDSIVKSPGQLVIMGYAPVPNIEKVCTPDIKNPGNSYLGFIDLGKGKNRLGGSSLAQTFGQIGDTPPDVDDPDLLLRVFKAVQEAICKDLILSLHDRSDGGLITTLIEMCMSGLSGAEINISNNSDIIAQLFSEELGLVFEYTKEKDLEKLFNSYDIEFVKIGKTIQKKVVVIRKAKQRNPIFRSKLSDLRMQWEATSLRLEESQTNIDDVNSERKVHKIASPLKYHLTFEPTRIKDKGKRPIVAILRQEGTNGDREMAAAYLEAGLEPWDVTMSDLQSGRITLDQFQGLVFPGGFSFMDVFGSGKGWAGVIKFNENIKDQFDHFYNRPDTFSLGVCNGCQLMALLGWVPGGDTIETSQPYFTQNHSGRFESRFVRVKILPSPSILLKGMEGSILGVWVAHGEGRLVFPDPKVKDIVQKKGLAPIVYINHFGTPTKTYPYNPNGSEQGLTALCSQDGRHLAMMPHPERCFQKWQWPWMPKEWETLKVSPWLHMFQNASKWCKEHKV